MSQFANQFAGALDDQLNQLRDLSCSCGAILQAFVEGVADTSDSSSAPCMDEFSTAAWERNPEMYDKWFQQRQWDGFYGTGIYAVNLRDAHVFAIEHGDPLHDVYDAGGEKVSDGHHIFEEPEEESTTYLQP